MLLIRAAFKRLLHISDLKRKNQRAIHRPHPSQSLHSALQNKSTAAIIDPASRLRAFIIWLSLLGRQQWPAKCPYGASRISAGGIFVLRRPFPSVGRLGQLRPSLFLPQTNFPQARPPNPAKLVAQYTARSAIFKKGAKGAYRRPKCHGGVFALPKPRIGVLALLT